jgi:hypothetical protein
MKKIYFSHGEKGGCGKSMTALLALETLYAGQGPANLVAIETDTSNPDFGRKAKFLDGLQLEFCNLRDQSGWNELVDLIERAGEDASIIINLPSQVALWATEIELVRDALADMGASVVVFWTINRQRDSVTLLEKAIGETGDAFRWIVVKNLYFGTPEKFEIFDISNGKKGKKALPVISIPEAPDFFVDHVMQEQVTFSTLGGGFSAYERTSAKRMLAASAKEFSCVL